MDSNSVGNIDLDEDLPSNLGSDNVDLMGRGEKRHKKDKRDKKHKKHKKEKKEKHHRLARGDGENLNEPVDDERRPSYQDDNDEDIVGKKRRLKRSHIIEDESGEDNVEKRQKT